MPNLTRTQSDMVVDPVSGTKVSDQFGILFGLETFIDNFPRQAGETDDSPRLGRAIQSAITTGRKRIRFSSLTYTFNLKTTITTDDLEFVGVGYSTILQNGNNTTIFDVQSYDVHFRQLQFSVTDTNRTNYSVTCTNANRPVFDAVFFNGVDGSYRSGLYISGATGSMGTVVNSLFNHSCIRTDVWDVKIDKTYIWAMSCEFGIGLYNGVGNVTITNTDIVSPLVSNANGKYGVYVDGSSGSCYNINMDNVYLDGNPTLQTRGGIYVGNGAGNIVIKNVKANRMDSDVITLDSVLDATIDGGAFYNNNDSGTGAREIVVKQTGTQAVQSVKIKGLSLVMTRDVTGTKAPAIYIDPAVDGNVVQVNNVNIYQKSTLGGYSDPEISCDATKTDLSGVKGTASKYSTSGSMSIPSGSTAITINLSSPYPMAYQPLASDIIFNWMDNPGVGFRVQFTSRNQVYIAFASATTAISTLYWKVQLSK